MPDPAEPPLPEALGGKGAGICRQTGATGQPPFRLICFPPLPDINIGTCLQAAQQGRGRRIRDCKCQRDPVGTGKGR